VIRSNVGADGQFHFCQGLGIANCSFLVDKKRTHADLFTLVWIDNEEKILKYLYRKLTCD
jgi:hypothetical protein